MKVRTYTIVACLFLMGACKATLDVEGLDGLSSVSPEFNFLIKTDQKSTKTNQPYSFSLYISQLDFSNKNCPILIDQPEDDLDNRAIYLDLVQYLKKKKQLRQIILATHNPNIVVGADSELVIVANQHGIKNENQDKIKFEYTSGSLECSFAKVESPFVLQSQGVREHVCEILEGGDVAFKHREQKYSFAH